MLVQPVRYRYSLLSLFVMALVFAAGTNSLQAAPPQQGTNFTWNPGNRSITVLPNGFTQFTATLTNNTAASETVDIAPISALPSGWTQQIAPATNIAIPANSSTTLTFTIGGPATIGSSAFITFRATPVNPALNAADFPVTAQVATATATPSTSTFSWSPVSATITVAPGGPAVQANLTLQSNSSGTQTYNITTNIASFPGWGIIIAPSTSVSITGNSSVQFAFFVNAPVGTPSGASIAVQITATRQSDGTPIIGVININVAQATATPTLTTTLTPTTGPVCPEGSRDPGGDLGSARLIVVDTPNNHGICSQGDEDWFKFAAIGGKVYTPDITRFDPGLDLVLELYDAAGNRLAFNDDFFARTPQPTAGGVQTPLPTRDIAPRIQSWRAPQDGIYYVRVRDAAMVGGGNRTYIFVVFSESYGPTPATVAEICRDLFEEDGLPEEAKLITSNEIQRGHLLCPTGDADWVKFFGKAGKTYYIYTDTRPYKNNPGANPSNTETQAGADTIIFLTDRDGASIIDFNDDIEGADGSSLDSQVRFVPTADGFYFVQIKNTGDIGSQFIRYDLVLTQCFPGRDDCGRARSTVGTAPTAAPAITQTPVTFSATVTPVTSATPVQFLEQSQPAAQGGQPAALVNGPVAGFASSTFEQVWQRADQPIAQGRVARSWLWGPRGLMARSESYRQSAGGLRQVQYFDKGRMEVGDPNSSWSVTTGLLAVELITGRMQVGDNDFVQRGPADVPVAGDQNAPDGPTYASFLSILGQQIDDRTGALPGETINRNGQIGRYEGPARTETRLVRYVPETGHNIASVFWNYMNTQGLIAEGGRMRSGQLMDWVFTMGYPVSEPFWARVTVGGQQRDVLIQIFQRRVLTYDPANPSGWRIEAGNVGRHYYRWRYGEDLPAS